MKSSFYRTMTIGLLSVGLLLTGCTSKEVVSHKPSASQTDHDHRPAPETHIPDPFAKFAHVQVVEKQDKGTNVPTGVKVDITYPQITGLQDTTVQTKINALLKEKAVPKEFRPDEDFTMKYQVQFQKGAILNVLLNSYVYPHGAAHGMPNRESLIISLATGDTFGLKDLIKSEAGSVDRLTQHIKGGDYDQTLSYLSGYPGVKIDDSIYLTDGGFVIYYYPYQYAPYALGYPEFRVSYEDVSDIINTEGELWKSLPPPDAKDKAADEDFANYAKAVKLIRSKGYRLQVAGNDPSASTPDGNGKNLLVYSAYKDGSEPDQIMFEFFFDGDTYIGTDTGKPHSQSSAKASGDRAITVTYHWTKGNQSGQFNITYHWDGSKIVPDQDLDKLMPK